MDQRTRNHKSLMKWVGHIPEHGESLKVRQICWDICRLLSHRTVSEVEAMLVVLFEHGEAEGADSWEYELPPPEFNWPLHGTVLWRVIRNIRHGEAGTPIEAENWEYVAVAALFVVKKAAASLRADPIGLGLLPRKASTKSQYLAATANQWLTFANLERVARPVHTGVRVLSGSEKGGRSQHKQDQKNERRERILEEAQQIRKKNPTLKRNGIAIAIERRHTGKDNVVEPGFGRRIINQRLKEAGIK